MPLLGAGWLSGYAVTTFIGFSRKLKWTSTCASPLFARKHFRSSSRCEYLILIQVLNLMNVYLLHPFYCLVSLLADKRRTNNTFIKFLYLMIPLPYLNVIWGIQCD